MFVKPKPGLSFRDPVTKIRVPETGMEIDDLAALRLIRDGDAELAEPPIEAAPAAPAVAPPAVAPPAAAPPAATPPPPPPKPAATPQPAEPAAPSAPDSAKA